MKTSNFVKAARAAVWIALIGWTGFGIWNGVRGTLELYELSRNGKFVTAQVIGEDHMPAGQRNGLIHYAFNDGTHGIENRFAVPVAAYADYPLGSPIQVTYLPGSPHTVRMGKVTIRRVAITAVSAVMFIVAGLVAFGLALIYLSGKSSTGSSPRVT